MRGAAQFSKQVSASRSEAGWLTVCSHRAEWPEHFMCKPALVWLVSDVMKRSWQAESSHSRCSPTLPGPGANAFSAKACSGNRKSRQNTSGNFAFPDGSHSLLSQMQDAFMSHVNGHWKWQASFWTRACAVEVFNWLLTGAADGNAQLPAREKWAGTRFSYCPHMPLEQLGVHARWTDVRRKGA